MIENRAPISKNNPLVDSVKLERFYGYIQVNRIPLEYRAKKCSILIKGMKYKDVVGFTHLVYLIRRNKDIISTIGGFRNRYNVKKDFSSYVYLCKDFFFPNIPADRIVKEKDYYIAKFVMLELENKTKFSHVIKNGRIKLGNCLKIHTSVYDEITKKVLNNEPNVTEKTLPYSFSPSIYNVGVKQVVKLDEDF